MVVSTPTSFGWILREEDLALVGTERPKNVRPAERHIAAVKKHEPVTVFHFLGDIRR
jgi:hypothetical protein